METVIEVETPMIPRLGQARQNASHRDSKAFGIIVTHLADVRVVLLLAVAQGEVVEERILRGMKT